MEHSSTSALAAATPFLLGFLDFPAEVRIEVYRHLFTSAQLSLEAPHPNTHCRTSFCCCDFPWHIVNTCQTLRYEALPYLLAVTTLQITAGSGKAALLPALYVESVPRLAILNIGDFAKQPLDLRKLLGLRTLELRNIAVWCHFHDKEYLLSDDANTAMVDMVMFNLKRTSVQLHDLCSSSNRNFNVLLFCRFVISDTKQETLVSIFPLPGLELMHVGCRG